MKSLFKATTLYLFGSFFNKAMSLLLLPVFTELLSPAAYGVVSTYLSWVNIITIFIGVQFGFTIRNAFIDYKGKLERYIFSIDLISLCISILLVIISIVALLFIDDRMMFFMFLFCIIQAFGNSVINVELQRQMMNFEYIQRTILLSAPNLLSAMLGISVLYYFPLTSYLGRIVPMVLIYTIYGFYYLICYYYKTKDISIEEIQMHVDYAKSLSIPLIFHGLASVLLSNIDRTMLSILIGTDATGIYSVAYTMGMALLAITSAMESVWIPWFTNKMNKKDFESINSIGMLYAYVGAFVCIIALLCMPEVFKLFASKLYWNGISVLIPIILSSYFIFLFTIYANIEYYYKSTSNIAKNTVLACFCNIVLNFIIIPLSGALGAALSTVFSYIISLIMHYNNARFLNNHILHFRKIFIPTMSIILVSIISYIFIENIIIRWSIALCSTAILLVLLLKNNNIKMLKYR